MLPDGGEDLDGGFDAGTGPVPVDGWCEMKARAECGRKVRCLQLDPAQLDACVARVLERCDGAAYARGVADGRLQYSEDQAGQCIDAYGEGSCLGTPEACADLFQGKVPPDGGCLLPEECAEGSFCLTYTNTCPFRCYAFAGIGEPCNFWDAQCDERVANCEQVDAGFRACVSRVDAGAACTSSRDCLPDLACVDDTCVPRQAKIGEPCGLKQGFPFCEPEAFCRQDVAPSGSEPPPGVCVRRPGLGGSCPGAGTCLPNLRCSSAFQTGTCIPLGSSGETCSGYSECKGEMYCSVETSTCAVLPEEGGDCTNRGSYYTCAPGYYCDFQVPDQAYVCRPRRVLGEECLYDEVCLSNACEVGPLPDGGVGRRCDVPCSQRVDGGF